MKLLRERSRLERSNAQDKTAEPSVLDEHTDKRLPSFTRTCVREPITLWSIDQAQAETYFKIAFVIFCYFFIIFEIFQLNCVVF